MKFIRFKEALDQENCYIVNNHKGDRLGFIEWKGDWKIHKQYIFCPLKDTFFTNGCLLEIVEKLNELNKKNKDGEVHKCEAIKG